VKRQGDVLTYYGAMAYWEGWWDDALELYERGRQRSERAGDAVGSAIASMNIAEVRSDQGRLEEAEGPARDALRVFRAAGYAELIATDCCILGRLVSRAGRHEEGVTVLTEALEQSEHAGAQLLEVGTLGLLAEDRVRVGDAEAAFAYLDRAQARMSSVGGAGVYEPLLERVRGCAHIVRGELEDASKALDRSLDAARSAGSEFEVMLSLTARSALAHVRVQAPTPENVAETESIAERLGIDSVPTMMPAVLFV
jgi:ATP/maltotriose-dependent transcriptional regulator MalT